MSKTIELSPVTRIEGHLAIKVEVEDGKVAKAYIAGEMFPDATRWTPSTSRNASAVFVR